MPSARDLLVGMLMAHYGPEVVTFFPDMEGAVSREHTLWMARRNI